MTSILLEIESIRRTRFNCNDLEDQKLLHILVFFLFFFCYFSNLHQILNLLKKKIIVIATFLRNVQALKDLVRPHSKKPYFRTPFDSQHVKVSHTLVKSE